MKMLFRTLRGVHFGSRMTPVSFKAYGGFVYFNNRLIILDIGFTRQSVLSFVATKECDWVLLVKAPFTLLWITISKDQYAIRRRVAGSLKCQLYAVLPTWIFLRQISENCLF